MAEIRRFGTSADPDVVCAALDEVGAVIIEGLLSPEVMARVNEEVEDAVAAADPDAPTFNPITKLFIHRQFLLNEKYKIFRLNSQIPIVIVS